MKTTISILAILFLTNCSTTNYHSGSIQSSEASGLTKVITSEQYGSEIATDVEFVKDHCIGYTTTIKTHKVLRLVCGNVSLAAYQDSKFAHKQLNKWELQEDMSLHP